MISGKMAHRQHKSPARVRYEQSHPTMSFRLERGLCNQLKAFLDQRGISCSDFVKEAMGAQGAIIKEAEEARLEGYKHGCEEEKLKAKRDMNRALSDERTKLRAEKEQAVKEARDEGYNSGYERGRLDESEHSNKVINDRIVKLRAEKEELVREAKREGHKQGYSEGYAQAKEMYLVSYDCVFCGERIEVATEKEKSAISRVAKEYEWGHESCQAKEEQKRQAQEAERLEEEARRKEFEAKYGTRAMERGFESDIG